MPINPSQPLSDVPGANHCVYCGTVAALYDHGRPICIRCSDRQNAAERLTQNKMQGIRVELLITRLDTALTFMDVGATSDIQETADHIHQRARQEYDTVLHRLANLTTDAQQRSKINEKMSLLKRRLQAARQF